MSIRPPSRGPRVGALLAFRLPNAAVAGAGHPKASWAGGTCFQAGSVSQPVPSRPLSRPPRGCLADLAAHSLTSPGQANQRPRRERERIRNRASGVTHDPLSISTGPTGQPEPAWGGQVAVRGQRPVPSAWDAAAESEAHCDGTGGARRLGAGTAGRWPGTRCRRAAWAPPCGARGQGRLRVGSKGLLRPPDRLVCPPHSPLPASLPPPLPVSQFRDLPVIWEDSTGNPNVSTGRSGCGAVPPPCGSPGD